MTALRSFVADVLDTQGAMIDLVDPDGLDVIAPEPLRAAFGWPELARLGFGPQSPAGALPIGLEGDWLDRFGALLGEHGRFAERQLVLDTSAHPPADPTALINHALELPNAVWRLTGSAPAWTRLLLLTFRTTAISDEKREGLVTIGLNTTTGAVLGPDLLGRLGAALETTAAWTTPDPATARAAGPTSDPATLSTKLRPLIEHRVRQDLDPFVAAMRRRLDRDRTRVHAYHDDLRRAAFAKLAAARRSSAATAEASAKREAAAHRRHRARLRRQARRSRPQLRAEGDGGVGASPVGDRARAAVRAADQAPQGRAEAGDGLAPGGPAAGTAGERLGAGVGRGAGGVR